MIDCFRKDGKYKQILEFASKRKGFFFNVPLTCKEKLNLLALSIILSQAAYYDDVETMREYIQLVSSDKIRGYPSDFVKCYTTYITFLSKKGSTDEAIAKYEEVRKLNLT